jgi:hypothetical protein
MLWLPTGSTGGLVGTDCRLVALPRVGDRARATWSGHNADLTEGQLDALWTQMHRASESLELGIPSSVAHDSPDDIGEE